MDIAPEHALIRTDSHPPEESNDRRWPKRQLQQAQKALKSDGSTNAKCATLIVPEFFYAEMCRKLKIHEMSRCLLSPSLTFAVDVSFGLK